LWREIIEGAKCGVLVNPQKTEEVAEVIAWLLTHPVEAERMGRLGREAVMHEYSWGQEEGSLFALYEDLA
jgi:hypothetical protein